MVSNVDSVLNIISESTKSRKIAATTKNDSSSRSHAILTIYIFNKGTNKKIKFCLVDLAGSEKPDDKNMNLKSEGICMNQGLSFLKLALMKLSKNEHVVFRGNDLVRILEDSFTGDSVSLFIACINPEFSNYRETFDTLNYSNSIKRIKNIHKPITNHKDEILKELASLRNFKKIVEQIIQKENADDILNKLIRNDSKLRESLSSCLFGNSLCDKSDNFNFN